MSSSRKLALRLVNFIPAVMIFVGDLVGEKFVGFNMILIFVVAILNYILLDKIEYHKDFWALIFSVVAAQLMSAGILHFISKEPQPMIVGIMFCFLYGGLALALMLIGNMIKKVIDYYKNK